MSSVSPHFDPPLKERLRFLSSVSSTSRIVDDRALMARTFSYLFGMGGTLVLLTLLLPGASDRHVLGLLGVACVSYLAAGVLIVGYDRLPKAAYWLSPMLGNVLVALAIAFGGTQATGAYALFYFWVALAAFYFFELRWAMICGAVASASYAVVIALRPAVSLGQLRWVMLTGSLFVFGVITGRLRSRAEELVTRLSSAARIDVQTGLPNRREFDARLAQEVARSKRVGIEFGLVWIDLDRFQPINDSAGHHAGDLVLEQVARLMRREVREADTVARVGGDEFAVIVPEAAQVETYLVAERLRKKTREEIGSGSQKLSMSAGVAILGRHGNTARELAAAAAQALVAAKRLGRDRTVIFSDEVASNLLELGIGASTELPTSLETILSLAELVDVSQMGSARHSQVVGRYAEAMGERFELDGGTVQRLRLAGILHDVGKIGVRGSILAKPGPLTAGEMDEMRTHPEVGARIARNAGLTDIAVWIGAHHERPDGAGYPRGLNADDIPLQARILAVADAFEAMTNDRAYRPARSPDWAREELLRHAGSQFDERVVGIFVELLDARAFDDSAPSEEETAEVRVKRGDQPDEPSVEASSTK